MRINDDVFRVSVGLLALILLPSCSPSSSDGRAPLAGGSTASDVQARATEAKLPLEAVRVLDAGNLAYREQRHVDAVAHYRDAAALAPENAAPWFGIYMAAIAMNDTALADSAMARVNALSANPSAFEAHANATKPAGAPSDSAAPAPIHALPPGHPPAGGAPAPPAAGRKGA